MRWPRRILYGIAAPTLFTGGYILFRLFDVSEPAATMLSIPLSLPPALALLVDIYPALDTDAYRSGTTVFERRRHITYATIAGAGIGIPLSVVVLWSLPGLATANIQIISSSIDLAVALAVLWQYTSGYRK